MKYFHVTGEDKKVLHRDEIITQNSEGFVADAPINVPINSMGRHLKIKFYLDNLKLVHKISGEFLTYRIGQYFELEHGQVLRLRTPEFIYDFKYFSEELDSELTTIYFASNATADIPSEYSAILNVKAPVYEISFYDHENVTDFDGEIYAEIFVPVTRNPNQVLISLATGEMVWVDQNTILLPMPTTPNSMIISDENRNPEWIRGVPKSVVVGDNLTGQPEFLPSQPNSFLGTNGNGNVAFMPISGINFWAGLQQEYQFEGTNQISSVTITGLIPTEVLTRCKVAIVNIMDDDQQEYTIVATENVNGYWYASIKSMTALTVRPTPTSLVISITGFGNYPDYLLKGVTLLY